MKRSKSIFKQILSLVLSCIILLQLVPLSVFAADETSGSCGPNLTWRLDGDTLYIEGYGPMYDYGVVYDEEGKAAVENEQQLYHCRCDGVGARLHG